MNTKLMTHALLALLWSTTAQAQQAPPSGGPSLYPQPAQSAESDAARAGQPASADAPVTPAAPQAGPKSDSKTAPSARAPRPTRRAVDQVLTPTPRILGSATPASGQPVLRYGPALQANPPAPPATPQRGSVPANCTGTGCIDAGGQRLNPGVGNALTTPQGQLCTRGLVGVQCF